MLQHLYKTLLITVMSCSLMTMNITVFAADASSNTTPIRTPVTPDTTNPPITTPVTTTPAPTTPVTVTPTPTTSDTTIPVTTAPQNAADSTTAISGMSKASDPNITMDANGALSKSETIKLDDPQAKSGAMSIIIMLAIGIIGAKILMYKKRTMDMTIGAVGCVAYIVGEVFNIKSLKDRIAEDQKASSPTDGSASSTSSSTASSASSTAGGLHGDTFILTKTNDGKNDQAQIESLQKLKKSYEDAKKSAGIRKMLQLASAVAFGLAAVLALYQMVTEKTKKLACETAIKTSQAALSACVANPALTATDGPGCTTCQTQISALATSINISDAKNAAPGDSAPKLTEAEAALSKDTTSAAAPCPGVTAQAQKSKVSSACQSFLSTRYGYEAGGPIGMFSTATNYSTWLDKMLFANATISNKNMSSEAAIGDKNLIQKMINVLIPSAEASGYMGLLGLGVGAAAALMTAKSAIGKTIDKFIFNPALRAVLWGVLGAAAFAASKATQKEIDKLSEYIKKIDQILKDMATLQDGVKANNVTEQKLTDVAYNAAIQKQSDQQISTDPKLSTDCIANPGGTNCAPVSDQVKTMPGFTDLPDSLKTVTTQTAKLGDSLSGKTAISGTTLGAASTLAAKANAIGKLNKSLINKLNGLKQNTDFDKKGQELWGQLKAQTSRALASNHMTPNGFLSSVGITPPPGEGSGSGSLSDINKKYSGSASGAGGGGGQALGSSAKDKALDLDFKETAAEAAKAGEAGKEEKFDIGTNDINTNSNESIFQVISNRYIKSGYPKLLELIPASGQ